MDYYDEGKESYTALVSDLVEDTTADDTGITEATVAPRE